MNHFSKSARKITIVLTTAAMLCGVTGCSTTDIEMSSHSSSTSIYADDSDSSTESSPSNSSSSAENSSTAADSTSEELISSESTESSEPGVSIPESVPLLIPDSADIKICSVSQALASFNEIIYSTPGGSPEEVVKTLLERNIICFAAMQGKGWTYADNNFADSVVPINSDYFKSLEQINNLFYGTYTENQAWRLLHPQEVGGFGDVFRYDNGLYFDTSHLRTYHRDSFETETYAAIIKASDEEIIFGRYYESDTSGSSPNNMHFKAVKEYGEWRLENYIIDAPAYSEPDVQFITTARKGNPELMEPVKKQVGNIGGKPYWEWYGSSYHIEWCGAFVSWCYAQAGKDEPRFGMCDSEGKLWFEENGKWVPPDYADIAPADTIFFDWDLDGSADHAGLVIGTDGYNVYTVEGNRNDVCITRFYPLNFEFIMGYGLMDWE